MLSRWQSRKVKQAEAFALGISLLFNLSLPARKVRYFHRGHNVRQPRGSSGRDPRTGWDFPLSQQALFRDEAINAARQVGACCPASSQGREGAWGVHSITRTVPGPWLILVLNYLGPLLSSFFLISGLSYKSTFNRELRISSFPLYSI
jgi:hypothetical protein